MLTAGAAQENHPVFSRVVNLASLISYAFEVTVQFMLTFRWCHPFKATLKMRLKQRLILKTFLDKKLSDSGKAVGVCGVEQQTISRKKLCLSHKNSVYMAQAEGCW